MDNSGEERRAAAKCTGCETIGIVRITSDGTVRPLGQPNLCECEETSLRVLETDPDDDS